MLPLHACLAKLSWIENSSTSDGTEKTVTTWIDNLADSNVCTLTYEKNKMTDAGRYMTTIIDLATVTTLL